MTDPIFIFGALRSGTTMFRLMLNAHEHISNPGEFDFLFDAIEPDKTRPGGWHYDLVALGENADFCARGLTINKNHSARDQLTGFLNQLAARSDGVLTINVHRNIRKISALWPGCKFIHLLRDPRDVARSSIGMGWAGTHYHGVSHWIQSETDWASIADQIPAGHICEVKFEHLLGDITGTLRRVCDFVGVAFDPAMLTYHTASTYSAPDKTLVAQWKHKSSPYEIAQVEYRAGPLMGKYGYTLSQPPLRLGWYQKSTLTLRNIAYTWRFGIRRFGVWLFFIEKITRWLRLSAVHRTVLQKMRQIGRTHLR